MTHPPLHWLKRIEQSLSEQQRTRASSPMPLFPWDALSERLATLFQVPELRIRLQHAGLRPADGLLQGLGTSPASVCVEFTPLETHAFFLMGKEEINQLTTLMLSGTQASKGFLSSSLIEGFYSYLCTEVVCAANELNAVGDLQLKIGSLLPLPAEETFCVDVEIEHPKRTFFGRLACPRPLREALNAYFSSKPAAPLHQALQSSLEVTTSLSIGHVSLATTEYQQLAIGDFLLLDRCSFDPKTHKGSALLSLGETPLFRLRIKERELKIVDYISYQEEPHHMDSKLPDPSEHDEFSKPDLHDDNDNTPLWSSETTSAGLDSDTLVSLGNVPLTLVVEVGRIRIPLQELLNLSPGNIVELPIKPEQGVDITLNGKKVAKAELVKLGEALGIKILQLAP